MHKLTHLLRTRLVGQIIVVAIPFIGLLALVNNFAVNVPGTDQYAIVELLQKVDAGTLGFDDLWALHNEHRIFFPSTETAKERLDYLKQKGYGGY